MQETSALYRRLVTERSHWFEARLTIAGKEYREKDIYSINTDSEIFSSDPEIGKAVAAEVDLQVISSTEIPRMAPIALYTRVCTATEQSEWLPKGVFYIDTRQTTKNEDGLDLVTIHGYDAMLFSEQDYNGTNLTWPASDLSVVAEIAGKMGVQVDARTWDVMTDGNLLPLPAGLTMREVLRRIAGMYIGSFVMTDAGKLRLLTLLELPKETNYLIDEDGNPITFGGDRILV